MSTFRLMWQDQELGTVVDLSADQPEMYGCLHPPHLEEPFKSLYEFIANEDNFDVDPPFAPELLDDGNWRMIDENRREWPIFLPAIYPDDFVVCWRWRGEMPNWRCA